MTTQQTSGPNSRKGSGGPNIISPNNMNNSRSNQNKSTVDREMRTQSTGAVAKQPMIRGTVNIHGQQLMQNRQAMQYVPMPTDSHGGQLNFPVIQGQKNDGSQMQHVEAQPQRKNAVSSLGLKGKSPNELSVLGQRNGAITGLNLVSPTSNYIVGDLSGGAKSSMTHTS